VEEFWARCPVFVYISFFFPPPHGGIFMGNEGIEWKYLLVVVDFLFEIVRRKVSFGCGMGLSVSLIFFSVHFSFPLSA